MQPKVGNYNLQLKRYDPNKKVKKFSNNLAHPYRS
jgi:hypothetical protein